MAVQVSIRALSDHNTATKEYYGVTVDYEGIFTVVTKNASAVDDWVDRMYNGYMEHFIVGLDVEWKPPFGPHRNRLATLQFCVDGCRCLIFQIINADKIPYSLHCFLRDPRFKFVGVGIQSDVDKLEGDYDLCVNNFADLSSVAADKYGRKDLKNAGLMGLARVVLGCGEIEKPRDVRLSNWDQYQLTEAQIKYACVDAYVSFKIGQQLFKDD